MSQPNGSIEVFHAFSHRCIAHLSRCEVLMADLNLESLAIPSSCIADVCIVPIGTASASVSKEVAQVTRLFRSAQSTGKVVCTMHSAGTTIGMLHYVCLLLKARSRKYCSFDLCAMPQCHRLYILCVLLNLSRVRLQLGSQMSSRYSQRADGTMS